MTGQDYQAMRERVGSQVAVANALGIDSRTIQRREHGKMKITREAEAALHSLHAYKQFAGIFKISNVMVYLSVLFLE
jgi:DNA-binding transcriptional regulator YiaG